MPDVWIYTCNKRFFMWSLETYSERILWMGLQGLLLPKLKQVIAILFIFLQSRNTWFFSDVMFSLIKNNKEHKYVDVNSLYWKSTDVCPQENCLSYIKSQREINDRVSFKHNYHVPNTCFSCYHRVLRDSCSNGDDSHDGFIFCTSFQRDDWNAQILSPLDPLIPWQCRPQLNL